MLQIFYLMNGLLKALTNLFTKNKKEIIKENIEEMEKPVNINLDKFEQYIAEMEQSLLQLEQERNSQVDAHSDEILNTLKQKASDYMNAIKEATATEVLKQYMDVESVDIEILNIKSQLNALKQMYDDNEN